MAKLKRESCCCGGNKKNPCKCMEKGIMKCSMTPPRCPCYSLLFAQRKAADELMKIDLKKMVFVI
tara:strand:+ start:926 stop:1120 length:195 start_codon:yes stop_codon:yes gene_type:complete